MKLLLDQNISFKLAARLTELFGEARHVRLLGLATADDAEIWNYALKFDFTIVTFDRDFSDRSVISGSPPKVIWLRLQNPSTPEIFALFMRHHRLIL